MSCRLTILFAFLTFFLIQKGNAQTAIVTSGGDAQSNGGSISYSAGQVLYGNNFGDAGFEGQGVQQPYQLIKETNPAKQLGVSVYPNPSTNVLILEIDSGLFENIRYEIFDGYGRLLEIKWITTYISKINIAGWASANYFLVIRKNDEVIETFKILKINKP